MDRRRYIWPHRFQLPTNNLGVDVSSGCGIAWTHSNVLTSMFQKTSTVLSSKLSKLVFVCLMTLMYFKRIGKDDLFGTCNCCLGINVAKNNSPEKSSLASFGSPSPSEVSATPPSSCKKVANCHSSPAQCKGTPPVKSTSPTTENGYENCTFSARISTRAMRTIMTQTTSTSTSTRTPTRASCTCEHALRARSFVTPLDVVSHAPHGSRCS